MCKFTEFIDANYKKVSAQKTIAELGQRNFVDGNKGYLGITDILPDGCDEKTVLNKTTHVEHSLEQLIVFGRGHLGEEMVADMFEGLNYTRQVEVTAKTSQGIDIKGHIDFVIEDPKQLVIVEVKTTSTELDKAYESWINQVQAQMGLLKKKYPDKDVRAYVFAIDVNSGWHKPFAVEFNQVLFDRVIEKADEIAQHIIDGTVPYGTEQLYCTKCSFKGSCKTLSRGQELENLPEDVVDIVKKIKSLSTVEKQIKTLKSQLKEYMEATDTKRVKADDYTVSIVNVKGKTSVDVNSLKENLPEVFSQFQCEGAGYSYVKVI